MVNTCYRCNKENKSNYKACAVCREKDRIRKTNVKINIIDSNININEVNNSSGSKAALARLKIFDDKIIDKKIENFIEEKNEKIIEEKNEKIIKEKNEIFIDEKIENFIEEKVEEKIEEKLIDFDNNFFYDNINKEISIPINEDIKFLNSLINEDVKNLNNEPIKILNNNIKEDIKEDIKILNKDIKEDIKKLNFSIMSKKDYINNKRSFKKFKIYNEIKSEKVDTIDFIHPFSAKLFGCRGSGKTTYIINYLNFLFENNLNTFDKIFFVTTSKYQALFKLLKVDINFIDFDEIEELKDSSQKILYIFDDCMLDLRNNKIVQDYYTRGRHFNISLFSLEQHLNYSNNVERGNCDYFLLFNINDFAGLNTFHRKFCIDSPFNIFVELLEKTKRKKLPLIISNNLLDYKYRTNFNIKVKIKKDENDVFSYEEYDILKDIKPRIILPKIKKKNYIKIFFTKVLYFLHRI